MALSIFHIGLPLDHPTIPPEDRSMLTERLSALQKRMRADGYNYEIVHYSPETGLDGFKARLATEPCDGVLIGGGVVGNPELQHFRDRIIAVTREAAPNAKIMFFSHSEDVRTTLQRSFIHRI